MNTENTNTHTHTHVTPHRMNTHTHVAPKLLRCPSLASDELDHRLGILGAFHHDGVQHAAGRGNGHILGTTDPSSALHFAERPRV